MEPFVPTPHRGSPVADAALGISDGLGLSSLISNLPHRKLAELPDGGRCLTTAAAVDFNNEVEDSPDVRYLSVGGDRGSALRTSPELAATYLYILKREGENDGLVSVKSATWGKYLQTLDMDHLHQINFPLPHRWVSGAPTKAEVLEAYAYLASATSGEVLDG